MSYKSYKIFLLFLCCLILLLSADSISAAGLLPACATKGNCNLNEIAQIFGNIARFILGITGSFALLMFIIGGFYWLTAAGMPDRVEKGKKIITGAVIGIIIIFGAYIGVQFFMGAIGAGEASKIGASCGDNKIYAEKDSKLECVTECENEHPTWTCQTLSGSGAELRAEIERRGCETGLCPGAANVVCCPREGEGGLRDMPEDLGEWCEDNPEHALCVGVGDEPVTERTVQCFFEDSGTCREMLFVDCDIEGGRVITEGPCPPR